MRRACLIVFVLAGCARIEMPPVVVGPTAEPASLASFERLLSAVRGAGYDVLRVEPRYGSFSVLPHVASPAGATFEVQCYADGYVQLRIGGIDRSPRSGVVLVSGPLRAEAVRFADVIHAGVGGPAP